MQLWMVAGPVMALWMAPPVVRPAMRATPVMRVFIPVDTSSFRGGVVPTDAPPIEDSSMVVQGGSRCTWSDEEEWHDQVQVVLSTEGHTLDAEIELWYGPDNTIPCSLRVYAEDGHVRPVSAVIETPGDENTVAIRNTGQSDYPITADVITEIVDTPRANERELADSTYDSTTIEGGELRTYPFEDPSVDSVQVLLTTNGMPLNARIELLQGPDIKQVIELYTEDGLDRPFFCLVNTPGIGNVIRVVNTAAVEEPMTVSVVPHSVNPECGLQGAYELTGGYGEDELGEGGWGSVRERALSARRRHQGPQVYGRGFRAERSAEARRMRSIALDRDPCMEDPSGFGTHWGSVRERSLSARRRHTGGVGFYEAGFRAARSAENRQQQRWYDVGAQSGPYSGYGLRGCYGYSGGYGYNSGYPRAHGQPGGYGGPHSVKEGGRVPFGYRQSHSAENRRIQRYGY